MRKRAQNKSSSKIGFIVDDRLTHDRKMHLQRMVTLMKSHFEIEIIPSRFSESEVIAWVEKNKIQLVMLPWYLYLTWKKLEGHFGLLRLDGATVAGYFADPVLPFEFSHAPNYHRNILFDFYRFEQAEIELMMSALLHSHKRAGFAGMIQKDTPLFHMDWYDHDAASTRVLDTIYKLVLFQNSVWANRISHLHFYLHALWELFGKAKRSTVSAHPCAEFEVSEFNKRLAIKFIFESSELSVKNMLQYCWPNATHHLHAMNELIRNSDFIRVHHYPESQQVEITAFFIPSAPSIHYPHEVRGFWIEPLKHKYLKTNKDDSFLQKQPIQFSKGEQVLDQFTQALHLLRDISKGIDETNPLQRKQVEQRLSTATQIIDEIEKKLAQTKKAA